MREDDSFDHPKAFIDILEAKTVTSRIGPVLLLLALLIAFAGCTGLGSTGPDITDEAAKERALSAEETRVTHALGNTSYVTSSSVGVYGEPNATVINRTSTSVEVRVNVPYSYEYSCDSSSGAVDGLETNATYEVTNSDAFLVRLSGIMQNPCA